MKRQKICIIGSGLTGLVTAVTLSKLNLNIDLITDDIDQNIKSNRTTAISQDNYDFLKKLDIFKFSKKEFWPCSKMELYTENQKGKFDEIFKIKKNKKILYMMNNSKIIKYIIRKIKKEKIIKFKTSNKISEIFTSGLLKSVKLKNKISANYNLIIVCVGHNSSLSKTLFGKEDFGYSYDDISITSVLKHSAFENDIAKQIFSDDIIFALLPISKTKTSIVFYFKKNLINKFKEKKYLILKEKIKFYTNYFLKNTEFISKLELRDLNLFIPKKYYKDRILQFGDSLHVVHPLAGQGFNMVLRDLISLEKTLKNKIDLGLDIGTADILSEFSSKVRPRNFVLSLSIDFLKKIFSFKKKSLKKLRNDIITNLNKSDSIKNIFLDFANRGFKF